MYINQCKGEIGNPTQTACGRGSRKTESACWFHQVFSKMASGMSRKPIFFAIVRNPIEKGSRFSPKACCFRWFSKKYRFTFLAIFGIEPKLLRKARLYFFPSKFSKQNFSYSKLLRSFKLFVVPNYKSTTAKNNFILNQTRENFT